MKWLIILILFLILIAIIAVRYRRQINVGIEIFKMFRQLKNQTKPREKKLDKKTADKAAPLVRCAKCGTWTPQTSALNLRSKTFYCSANCMEKTVSFNG
jgi:hypothetical protein